MDKYRLEKDVVFRVNSINLLLCRIDDNGKVIIVCHNLS